MVGFVHSYRFRLSCKDHLDDWSKSGAVCWCSELRGFFGDMDQSETKDGSEHVAGEGVSAGR